MNNEMKNSKIRCKGCLVLVYVFLALTLASIFVSFLNVIGAAVKSTNELNVKYEAGSWQYEEAFIGSSNISNSMVPYEKGEFSSRSFMIAMNIMKILAERLPVLLILIFLRQLLLVIRKDYTPFKENCVKWVRIIGIVMILQGVFGNLLIQAGISTVVFHSLVIYNPLNLTNVFVGMLILVLAEIFQYGSVLQEEQDTTL
ncbi:MAG: DUF2975 domain-containing protein [bacterium]|nr:DUF2975 domain-containing protein [bacterium]